MDDIRVIVQYRDRLAGEALAYALNAEPGLVACCHTGDLSERAVLAAAKRRRAGIILMDYHRSSLDLVCVLRRRQSGDPELRTLVIGVPHREKDILDVKLFTTH